jgi:hypothetical protein
VNSTIETAERHSRKLYLRPLYIATAFSWFGELGLFLYYGVYANDTGHYLEKLIWTLGFCGIGMGMTLGGLIDLLLVGRVGPKAGIIGCVVLAVVTTGFACNWLCYHLNRELDYFGQAGAPAMSFLMPGLLVSPFAGWFLGWACFTEGGDRFLSKLRL